MSGKWDRPEIPKHGWSCVDDSDNGPGSDFVCEMCEVQEIRFLHFMRHPEYPEELTCGCICAGKMEGVPGAAHERERRLRLKASQRDRWPHRGGWKQSAKGDPYLRFGRLVIVVFPLFRWQPEAGYGFLVKDQRTNRELLRSRKPIVDEHLARQRTFDAVQWLEGKRKSP